VTALGAIAYRLDALCARLFDDMGAEYVRPFWDVHDEIVTYGMARTGRDRTECPVCHGGGEVIYDHSENPPSLCRRCGGKGFVDSTPDNTERPVP
jgi:hypothetical protein